MKVGFVNIFGKPNAGKSTLLNMLATQKLAIVSPKVQTTRNRIKAIITEKDFQIILSDTPGIIEPKYRLHEKMMQAVKGALEDADVALLIADIKDDWNENALIFDSLALRSKSILVLNKIDKADDRKIQEAIQFFSNKEYGKKIIPLSATNGVFRQPLLQMILEELPEGQPFFPEDELSDLSTRFFVGELIREKIFDLTEDELPYHSAVLVNEFKEKKTLIKIAADIIVHRESQKAIILGDKGSMIKKIGTEARKSIEEFLNEKVFLELFVKVKPKWRDNELYLKEYGY